MLDNISLVDLPIFHLGCAGEQCIGCGIVHLSGRKCWPPQYELSFAPSSCPFLYDPDSSVLALDIVYLSWTSNRIFSFTLRFREITTPSVADHGDSDD